ncbi:PIN domain-containing protein, partial [Trichothermofontia sp.]
GQSCFKINLTSFGNEAIIEHHFLFVRGQNTAFCPFFPSLNLTFNTSGAGAVCCDCRKDFEDAIQLACALAGGMDGIVTRNTQDFVSTQVAIWSPEQFVALYPHTSHE